MEKNVKTIALEATLPFPRLRAFWHILRISPQKGENKYLTCSPAG
jgi:hypothetical protein